MSKITNTTEQPTDSNMRDIVRELQQNNKQLMDKISKLESKDPSASMKDKKAHYKWLLQFSYKIWDWEPVITYTSTKKDSARPLTYRAVSGELVDNHYVDIETTSWVLKKPILLQDYTLWHERSGKMNAWAILKDGTEIKQLETKHKNIFEDIERYVFDTAEFGQFKVSPKAIN